MKINRLLIIGMGRIGKKLPLFLKNKFPLIYGVTRQPKEKEILRHLGVIPLIADLDNLISLKRIADISPTVVYLAPPSLASINITDQRLLNFLQMWGTRFNHEKKMIIYISTTSVYGDQKGKWVNETNPINPTQMNAKKRAHAEYLLRKWNQQHPTSITVILRVSGIYGGNRHINAIQHVKNQLPILKDQDDAVINRVHEDDLISIICKAIFLGKPLRTYNCSDGNPVGYSQWITWVAQYLDLPIPPCVTQEQLFRVISPKSIKFLQESRRVSNKRLAELRVILQHPYARDSLKELLQNNLM